MLDCPKKQREIIIMSSNMDNNSQVNRHVDAAQKLLA